MNSKFHCVTCVSHNLIGIVPPHCNWYWDNVVFGDKSAEECPYYQPMINDVQTTYKNSNFVIITPNPQGIWKYVSKKWYQKYDFPYTIKLNRAKKFDTYESAEEFANKEKLEFYTIKEVKTKLYIE